MNRRKLLLGSGVALSTVLAGCSSDETADGGNGNGDDDDDDGNGDGNGNDDTDEDDNSSEDEVEDETQPDSSDEEPSEPVVTKIGLVSEWEKPGDLEENEIESGSIDEGNWSAFQFDIYAHEGELEFTYQYDLYGPENVRRMTSSDTKSELVGGDGQGTYEQSIYFGPGENWPTGEYLARVTIRDEISGEVSEAKTTTFELR
ncbi:hypothetical protein [Natrinema sp. DC36]|uniref:hypothetical protein n=1 Tax=Natrinema sp. DC36 TaxID=2878680 RepID=UPI001CF03D0F|nr:hypothetical protein [Natrinema sp. DC36]